MHSFCFSTSFSFRKLSIFLLLAGGGFTQLFAQPTTITDITAGGAVIDGVITPEEYAGFSTGINSGFGDVIGAGSTFYIDSDGAGNLYFGLESGGGDLSDFAVIYLDTKAGGFSSTSSFLDNSDDGRSALSALGFTSPNRADITFAPGFEADYGIVFSNNFIALWELVAGGPGAHSFIRIDDLTPNANAGAGVWESDAFNLTDIGLTPGDPMKYIITYLNPYDLGGAFRSNEFHGVAAGSFTSGNIGVNPVTLADGDYNTFKSYRRTIIDDFEQDALPSGTDGDGLGVGYIAFESAVGGIALDITDAPAAAVPGATAGNRVLSKNMTLPENAFAGFLHRFPNVNTDAWVPMDWSTYEGIQLWIYGHNTGGTLFLDILDNRNPGSTTDDAERFSIDIPDDFSGWSFFEFTWDQFNRKEIGNGAPNDGLNLTEVNGYAIGGFGSVDMGTNTYYADDVAIWGTREIEIPLEAQFASNQYQLTEGGTAQIEIVLNRISSNPMTVTYATAESTAVPGRDFTPASSTVVIPAGETSATFPLSTTDNNKNDGDRSLMVVLRETDEGELGFTRRTRLTILDDEPADLTLIDDFEGFHPFQSEGNISATAIELADGNTNALPCQDSYEHALSVVGDGTLSRTFTEPQDWSASTGLNFWYYGAGSGETITVDVHDNRSAATATTQPADWVLAWSDEFDAAAGTPLNPNSWTHELGDGSLNGTTGWGNAELQYYTDDPANAAMDGNGNLVITTNTLDVNTTDLVCWYGPCQYTSARLITKNKINFEYGRIEARIQVPPGEDGLWPAFWALGSDIDEVGWPQTGEIDIMEYVSRLPNEIFGTIHGPGYSGGASFGNIYDFGVPVANDYHTFAIEWQPDIISWFVDGIAYHQAIPADVAPNEWVFNHPFFLLLNQAIGGNFGGAISPDLTFPQEMKVDYVRVYQAEDSAERFETSFTDDKAGWQLIYLPFDEFARSADQPAGAPDDGLGLNEVWGYSLTLPDAPALDDGVRFDQIRLTNGEPPFFDAGTYQGDCPDADGDGLPDFADSCPDSANAGLDFDGTDDLITTPVDLDADVAPLTTWEAWVYPTSDAPTFNMILSIDDGGWDRFLSLADGSVVIGHGSEAWYATTYTPNVWQHVAVVFDQPNNQIRFFRNGVDYGTFPTTFPNEMTLENLTIGATNSGGGDYFQGRIDEVRIWNVARSKAEILSSINEELAGNESGLLAYYNFNEGVPGSDNTGLPATALDKTGSYDAGLIGFSQQNNTSNWVVGAPINGSDPDNDHIGEGCDCDPANPSGPPANRTGPIAPGTYQDYAIESGGTVGIDTSVTFLAEEIILFKPGFHAKAGSDVLARIENCPATDPPPAAQPPALSFAESSIPKKSEMEASNELQLLLAPNPAHNFTNLQLQLPADGPVSIFVLNALGRRVAQPLSRAALPAGPHTYRLNTSHLTAGWYHVVVRTGTGQVVQKLVLIRD